MILQEAFRKFVNPCILDKQETELIKNINDHFISDSKVLPNYKGFTIAGNVGTGKTTIFKIVQWSKISKLFLCSTKQILDQHDYYVKKIIGKDIILDDLGEEDLGNDYGKSTDFIGDIISRRYDEWKYSGVKTYFTTNLAPKQIETKYGERVYERYKEMQTWVKYPSSDNKRSKSILIPPSLNEPIKDQKQIESENMIELDRLIKESIKQKTNLFKYNQKISDNDINGRTGTYYMVASVAYRYRAKNSCTLSKTRKIDIFNKSCRLVKLENIESAKNSEFNFFSRFLKGETKLSPKDNKYYKLAVTRSEAKAFEIWLEEQY